MNLEEAKEFKRILLQYMSNENYITENDIAETPKIERATNALTAEEFNLLHAHGQRTFFHVEKYGNNKMSVRSINVHRIMVPKVMGDEVVYKFFYDNGRSFYYSDAGLLPHRYNSYMFFASWKEAKDFAKQINDTYHLIRTPLVK